MLGKTLVTLFSSLGLFGATMIDGPDLCNCNRKIDDFPVSPHFVVSTFFWQGTDGSCTETEDTCRVAEECDLLLIGDWEVDNGKGFLINGQYETHKSWLGVLDACGDTDSVGLSVYDSNSGELLDVESMEISCGPCAKSADTQE